MPPTDGERIAALEVKVQHLTKLVERQGQKIDEMLAVLNQAKGAKYVIIGGAAIVGALTSFAAKWLPFLGAR